jgi:hypothetical protein
MLSALTVALYAGAILFVWFMPQHAIAFEAMGLAFYLIMVIDNWTNTWLFFLLGIAGRVIIALVVVLYALI